METIVALDARLFSALNNFVGAAPLFDAIVFFCAAILIYLLIAFVVFDVVHRDVFRRRRASLSRDLLLLLVTLGSSYGITEMLRDTVNRMRPFWENDIPHLLAEYSPAFPSGHTSFAFALGTFLYFLNEKRPAYVVWALAPVIGISRVVAGVHYPLDILGGAIVGVAAAWAVRFVISRAPRK